MDDARNLVICIDGTKNEPADARTNVQRLFRLLDKEPARQVVYYQPGVGTLDPIGVLGTLSRAGLRLLDAMTAWMMQRHVRAAYRFLSDHYRPGDRIFLFGFSRGAYAVRVLAGMLSTVGLLHAGMEEMYPFAWKLYASYKPRRASTRAERERQARELRRFHRFQSTYGRQVNVHFVGVWDTVSSVGNPWRPKVFNRTSVNGRVSTIRHAMALDERRILFLQNLWGAAKRGQDVRQVWFPGVHADVGGGYRSGTDSELAKIPFAWMLREARQAGLRVDQRAVGTARLASAAAQVRRYALAPIHDELAAHRTWRLLERLPIPRRTRQGNQWGALSYQPHHGRRRDLLDGALVHYSVFERMLGDADYQPTNLPRQLVIVH